MKKTYNQPLVALNSKFNKIKFKTIKTSHKPKYKKIKLNILLFNIKKTFSKIIYLITI